VCSKTDHNEVTTISGFLQTAVTETAGIVPKCGTTSHRPVKASEANKVHLSRKWARYVL